MMRIQLLVLSAAVTTAAALAAQARPDALTFAVDRGAASVMDSVVAWRRDFHQHPELGNRETRTAGIVAAHLRRLGMTVRTGVAHTGVVGVLRGGRPGPVVALRADMDALPVTEEVDLPFASRARGSYNGQDVGVMHACGHDMHTAILMGVATVLAGVQRDLPGTVLFIFQPAEEGAPAGESGGASLMLRDGAFDDPAPAAIFGLHVFAGTPTGRLAVKPGPLMAAADQFRIVVRGRQTHGGMPWLGTDPVVTAAQVILGLQSIVSRQSDLTRAPAVISVGIVRGGVRVNIIPDSVELAGTIRTFDAAMRSQIHERIRRTATSIAQAAGGSADVAIDTGGTVITFNDSALTTRMLPTLRRVNGEAGVVTARVTTTAEDFSFFQQRVPGIYFFLGVTPPGADPDTVASNHSPRFFADEAALPVGVRSLSHLAVDYLRAPPR
jgi:amidohydrolase